MNSLNTNKPNNATIACQFVISHMNEFKLGYKANPETQKQLYELTKLITDPIDKDRFVSFRNGLQLDTSILTGITKSWNYSNTFQHVSGIKQAIQTINVSKIYDSIQEVIDKGITLTKDFITTFIEKCGLLYRKLVSDNQNEIITNITSTLKKRYDNLKDITNKEQIAEYLSNIFATGQGFWAGLTKEVRYGIILAFITTLMMFAGGGSNSTTSTDDGRGNTADSTQVAKQDTLSPDEGRSTAGTMMPGDEIVDTKDIDHDTGSPNPAMAQGSKTTKKHGDKKTVKETTTIKEKSEKKEHVTFATKKTSFEKIKNYLSILKFRGRTDRENGTPACAKSARLTLQKFKIEVPQKGSAIEVHKYYKNTPNHEISDEYDDYIGKAVGKDLKPHLGTYLQQLETKGANVVDIYISSPHTYKKYYTKIVKGKKVRKSKRVSYGHRIVGIYGRDTKERYIVDAYNGFKKPVRWEEFQEWCYKKKRNVQSIAGFESQIHIGDKELVGTYKKNTQNKFSKHIPEEYASKKKPKVEPNFTPSKVGSTKGSLLSHSRFEDFKKNQLDIIEKSTKYIAKNLSTKKRFRGDNVGETIEEGIQVVKDQNLLPPQLAHMYRGIVLQESKGDYDVKNGSYEGLAQMGKEDAEFVGMDPDDRDDPSKSVKGSLDLLRLKYQHLNNSKVVKEFMKKYNLDNKHFLYPLVVNSYCAGEGTMETIVKGISGKKHRKAIHSYIAQHGKRGAMLYVMDKGHSYSRIYNKEKKNYVPSVTLRTEQILGNQPITTLIGP